MSKDVGEDVRQNRRRLFFFFLWMRVEEGYGCGIR